VSRKDFARRIGKTHGGKRDIYEALGYPRTLSFEDYWEEYSRGGLAKTIVEAFPSATWYGGADLVDKPREGETTEPINQHELTPFEEESESLAKRLGLWDALLSADVLAGIGKYAIVVIGAPGAFDTPLTSVSSADDIAYLSPYGQDRVEIVGTDGNKNSPRFGLPEFYSVKVSQQRQSERVHHTRVLHIAEGRLDNPIEGQPRLRACWNYLLDLAKVVGGGAEAAWKRMDPGLHIDVDPDVEFDEDAEDALETEVDEYQHDVRRTIRTRGVKVTPLFANVAAFGSNVDSILALISATVRIPQRILTGSERGQLASTQDKNNWNDSIRDRRRVHATPIVSDFYDRMLALKVLPDPTYEYTIRWPDLEAMDEGQKARAVSALAAANQAQFLAEGKLILPSDEIRDIVFNLGPLPEPPKRDPGDDKNDALDPLDGPLEPQSETPDKRFIENQMLAEEIAERVLERLQ
jgi:hypothetical protein